MKKAIIHLSDLHVSSHFDSDGMHIDSKYIQSFFTTDSKDEVTNAYLDKIISKIKKTYGDNNYELFLIVTGDISDKAQDEEFNKCLEILNKLCESLNIKKENVLLVPGDHDVNRDDCRFEYSKNKTKENTLKAFDYHDAKFKKYKKFVDDFYKDELFDAKKTIARTLLFNDEILFLGLNSNFKIGTKSGNGYIPLEELKKEIESLNTDKEIVCVFHHNFNAEYDDKATGQWEKLNLNALREYLQSIDVKLVLYGNEHTPCSLIDKFYLSACGSIGSKKSESQTLKVYKYNNENGGIKFEIDFYSIRNHGNHSNFKTGYLDKENSPENEIAEIILKDPVRNNVLPTKKTEIPFDEDEVKDIQKNTDYSKSLMQIIKTKNLFHSGHFHWSKTSRAHNWIDVTKILNNYNDVLVAKDAILDLIEKNVGKNYDFIIGLGIEGNILSTKVSIKHSKPHAFLPYSYRYDDHHEFEKELCFENDGIYKSVLIITDVVNEGRTIRKLLHKESKSKEFFNNVEKVYVVSLFYTGNKSKKNPQMINLHEVVEGDYQESRIEFYYVQDLKVEGCPYDDDNYQDECIIIKENLGCVYRFYDEDKKLN